MLANVVAPVAVGYDVANVERFHRYILGAGFCHHKRAAVMAIAAVEIAMWDVVGRRAGLLLHALWGGLWRERVEASAYLFISDLPRLKDAAKAFLDAGYTTFKIKIGLDSGTDIPLVEAVREVVGACALRADVNGAWTPGTAHRQLAKLAPYDLAYVEQPLELGDLTGHRRGFAAATCSGPFHVRLCGKDQVV